MLDAVDEEKCTASGLGRGVVPYLLKPVRRSRAILLSPPEINSSSTHPNNSVALPPVAVQVPESSQRLSIRDRCHVTTASLGSPESRSMSSSAMLEGIPSNTA